MQSHGYDASVLPPDSGDEWLGLTDAALPIGAIYDWCVRPDCGAVVLFSGTVRDHAADADGVERQDVQYLEYEAYDEMVVPKLAEIAAETRARWSEVGRIAMIHRVGRLELGESSVVCAVSAPHRPQAFVAARFAIDALKVSVPVWKREVWPEGSDWGTNAADLVDVADVPVSASSEVDT
ncbi:MAG: molybdenum cofactor biosynthesis protein MoaE [Ilumatobacter sp.]|nr:molybdenum cofactor biosynthesis protein MoaE [Ilumatobacter sp.]